MNQLFNTITPNIIIALFVAALLITYLLTIKISDHKTKTIIIKEKFAIFNWSIKYFYILLGICLIQAISMLYYSNQLTELIGSNNIIDSTINYSPQTIQEMFDNMGEIGLSIYAKINIIDYFFAFTYPLILGCCLYYVISISFATFTKLYHTAFLPLFGGMFDLLENIIVTISIRDYPHINDQLIKISNILTLSKYSILLIAIIILVSLISIAIFKHFQKST